MLLLLIKGFFGLVLACLAVAMVRATWSFVFDE